MTVNALSETIESQEFIAQFSVLSGFNTVISALQNNEVVSELIALLEDSIDNEQTIVARIEQLLPQYEVGYMHSYDIPILVYLFVLNEVGNTTLHTNIADNISAINETWWSRKFANQLIDITTTEYQEA